MTSKYIKKYVRDTPRQLFTTPTKQQVRGYILIEDRFGRKRRRRPFKKGIKERNINIKARDYFDIIGRKALREGWHPQMWREKYRWLGPIGSLGDDVIIKIDMTFLGLQLLQFGISGFDSANILKLVEDNIYKPLFTYTTEIINIKVPSEMGDLRETMVNSLTEDGGSILSSFPDHPFMVVLNTGELPYSKPVNEMEDEWLQHPGLHSGRALIGKRSKLPLEDPEAVQHWYEFTLINSRIEAKNCYKDFIRAISDLLPDLGMGMSSYKLAKTLFNVRFK